MKLLYFIVLIYTAHVYLLFFISGKNADFFHLCI